MFEAALGTFIFVLFLFRWIGFRRVVRFGFLTDIIVHSVLIYMFYGTYAGAMTGIIAATMVSMFLQGAREFFKRYPPAPVLIDVTPRR